MPDIDLKNQNDFFVPTPWDKKALGIDTYELLEYTEEALEAARKKSGHYTIKVDPLSSKKNFQKFGFYYCDTLIEPFCSIEKFKFWHSESVYIDKNVDVSELLHIGSGSFKHGRFHRDFNVDKISADKRYDNWLRQLHKEGNVFGIFYEGKIVSFFGYSSEKIVLHSVIEDIRGKGLAKYLWSAGCKELFESGHRELTSSVSSSNVAIINLYSSIGFKFRNPLDVYHGLF